MCVEIIGWRQRGGFRGSDLEIESEIGDGRMSEERGVMMKRETEEMLQDQKKPDERREVLEETGSGSYKGCATAATMPTIQVAKQVNQILIGTLPTSEVHVCVWVCV